MNKILNLRTTPTPIIHVVEKVVIKKAVWWQEVLKMTIIVVIVSGIVYAVSHAEISTQQTFKKFNAYGVVSNIDSLTLSIIDAHSSDKTLDTSYTFDTAYLTKIEDRYYTQLAISDIVVGDRLIVQGDIDESGVVTIHRIVSFGIFDGSATTTSERHVVSPFSVVLPETITSTSTSTTTTDTTIIDSSDPAISDASSTISTSTSSDPTPVVPDVTSDTPVLDAPLVDQISNP